MIFPPSILLSETIFPFRISNHRNEKDDFAALKSRLTSPPLVTQDSSGFTDPKKKRNPIIGNISE